jgi:hypothetical protein
MLPWNHSTYHLWIRTRVEVSFQAAGKLLEVDTTDMGTYQSVLGADGVLSIYLKTLNGS